MPITALQINNPLVRENFNLLTGKYSTPSEASKLVPYLSLKEIDLSNYNTKMIATLNEYLKFALYEGYKYTSYNYEDVIKQGLEIIPSDHNKQIKLIKNELPRMINNLKKFIKNNKIDYDELGWKKQSIEWKEYEV